MNNILSLKNISKTYSTSFLDNLISKRNKEIVKAVNNVCLSLPEGQILGLIGPNGSGKTTLLKIICGLINAEEGEIWINGSLITTNDNNFKKHIGFMNSNEKSFYWKLSVNQNLAFYAGLYGLSPQEATKRIESILNSLKLTPFKHTLFYSLSSGRKQLVGIARALITDPKILILDEPLKGLDYTNKNILRTFLQEFITKRNRAIIITSHELEQMEKLCTSFIFMDKGEIIKQSHTHKGLKKLYQHISEREI